MRSQVRVRIIDAGVDYGDDIRARSFGNVPRSNGADISAGFPRLAQDWLTCVLQSPELTEKRIIGNGDGPDNIVWLNVFHICSSGKIANQRSNAVASGMESQHSRSADYLGSVDILGRP